MLYNAAVQFKNGISNEIYAFPQNDEKCLTKN